MWIGGVSSPSPFTLPPPPHPLPSPLSLPTLPLPLHLPLLTAPPPHHSPSTPQEYHNDPEKLADLYYDLAQSYASSPELRKTWLSNLLQLHVSQGNYSEVWHCLYTVTAERGYISSYVFGGAGGAVCGECMHKLFAFQDYLNSSKAPNVLPSAE